MNRRLDRAVTVLRAVVDGAQSDRITFIAASLAYYAFISLLPLLLLALVAASVFGGPRLVDAVVTEVSTTLGATAGTLVEDALRGAAGRGGATVLGFVVLLWSGLKLFRGLDIAFSEVYGAPGPEGLFEQLKDAVVALGTVGIGVAATVVVGMLISAANVLGVPALPGSVGSLGLVAGLTVALLPLYYILPGPKIPVREALPGAILAAVGWMLLQTGFRLYATVAGTYEAYGVLGGVLLLITWLYFGSLLLLVGAVFNAVLAGRNVAPLDAVAGAEATGAVRSQRPIDSTQTMDRDERTDEEVSDAELREEIAELSAELDRFERQVDERTLHRDEIEADLKRYVRARMRRGKARGWGPYLVLLYGTVMTLGAFFLLSGGWAIAAMIVIWLSTLGLYALMLIVGATVGAAGLPGRLKDRFESR
ncbi:MAG: YihY/virulence factor BrkB family protein [Natronomonas sp.]